MRAGIRRFRQPEVLGALHRASKDHWRNLTTSPSERHQLDRAQMGTMAYPQD
jgi:hypothetical protein